ncbi:MAG: HD domain-containing protein [Clostridiales bacterium]|nr:HD domain-containing protein [Clostridiales bacterium]
MKNEELLEKLKWSMIEWERGCPQRIQHFLKVSSFAATIAKEEGADGHTVFLVSALGYIHDIGIRLSLEREGRSDGKSQEKHGEPAALQMLKELGFTDQDAARISMIVGKHHTYDAKIEGLDFRILLEADACVNMFESDTSQEAKLTMLRDVFRTAAGKRIYTIMFDLAPETVSSSSGSNA